MRCGKCLKEKYKEWKSGETYEGIDNHHNPPELTTEKGEQWVGEIIPLCRKHHKELHKKITELIREYSMRKKGKSDYWLWLYVNDRLKCRNEIIKLTKEWL